MREEMTVPCLGCLWL